jgi:hypothetical protein
MADGGRNRRKSSIAENFPPETRMALRVKRASWLGTKPVDKFVENRAAIPLKIKNQRKQSV